MRKTKNKKRGGKPFSIFERSKIETRWCIDFKSISEIAGELGRNKSSVSREIQGKPRKGRGRYQAHIAHERALKRIQNRGNTSKTSKLPDLKKYIENKMIDEQWSPEQISIRLPIEFRENKLMRIATESIYQEVYRRVKRDGNGFVKTGEVDLRPHLTRRHKVRAKKGFRKARKLERESLLPSIEDRPKAVEKRNRLGDWEDDTIVSKQSLVRLKNMTERKSGVTLFEKTADGSIGSCDQVAIKRLSRLPKSVLHTLTRDRGSENLNWKHIEKELGLKVYFAHAYSSYERGTNENTNGLIRRYFPKKTDFAKVTDDELKRAEYLINTRPRKRHGGLTPLEVLFNETGVAIYS